MLFTENAANSSQQARRNGAPGTGGTAWVLLREPRSRHNRCLSPPEPGI